jgi:hypothetical protein
MSAPVPSTPVCRTNGSEAGGASACGGAASRAGERSLARCGSLADIDGTRRLNEVVLNHVLVRRADGPTTEALIAEIQSDGRIWCGPTQWDRATAMRISGSSWRTGVDGATFTADVILDCAERVHANARP